MRRFLAIFLAVLFSSWLIVPAFAASTQSNLPACCRKNGEHHCALQTMSRVSGPTVVAVGERCPYFPRTLGRPHHEMNAWVQAAGIFAGWISHPGISPQTEAVYRVSRQRSHQKRGPPSLLILS